MAQTSPETVPCRSEEQVAKGEHGEALQKSREVRLGLVLYGGVSLAIYINGVAHEFFQAVRGRGVYRLLKALTDSDVAVDVISGTSAGGINGIFLGFCLCNPGSEFGRSAILWREKGDIRLLLRKPDDREAFLSLLDSKGFYLPELRDALAAMYQPSEEKPAEDPSLVNELDLFVTGTDVDGNTYTRFDDAGHPISIKDYRSVFLLKHRKGRKHPLCPKQPEAPTKDVTVNALAKLATITSCFPSAFEPVNVARDGVAPHPNGAGEDAELRYWGKLAQERDRCFLDGGVLDNKPFSYTLRTIFSRHALTEVDRRLCYIEPLPELYDTPTTASQPDIFKALVASLLGIPRYESISEDLKTLADHNSRVQQYNRILSRFQEPGGPLSTDAEPEAPTSSQRMLYERSRMVALSERVLRGIFRVGGRDVPISLQDPDSRRRVEALVSCFDEVATGTGGQGINVEHLFEDLDVTFRLRRLYHTVYFIHDLLYEDLNTVPREKVRDFQQLWHALNRQIELYEVLQAEMESLIDQANIRWQDFEVEKSREHAEALWRVVQYAFERLLDDSALPRSALPDKYQPPTGWDWLPPETLQAFGLELKKHARSVLEELNQATPRTLQPTGSGRSLLHLFESYEQEIFNHFLPMLGGTTSASPAASVKRAYERFEWIDTQLFPLELMGGLREKDVIQTTRISPRDAQRGFSHRPPDEKISGDLLRNFGGFFKRSWRANDILWGRLDGLCQLVELLLTRERLERLTSNESLLRKVRENLLEEPHTPSSPLLQEYDPEKLFPHVGQATHQRLRQWFQQLLSGDAEQRDKALRDDTFQGIQNLLIEAAQFEVLYTELENVLGDARLELESWRAGRTRSSCAARRWRTWRRSCLAWRNRSVRARTRTIRPRADPPRRRWGAIS